MVDFIDDHKPQYGVEPICRVLPIAPSTYYRAKELEENPENVHSVVSMTISILMRLNVFGRTANADTVFVKSGNS